MIVNSESLESDDGELQIIAYFTLALKILQFSPLTSKSSRKKMDGLSKCKDEVSGYLIGQLAKNDYYSSEISGKEIIDYAINIVNQAFDYVVGRFVLIECKDNENLISFYENNGFSFLQKDEDGLVQLYKILTINK